MGRHVNMMFFPFYKKEETCRKGGTLQFDGPAHSSKRRRLEEEEDTLVS